MCVSLYYFDTLLANHFSLNTIRKINPNTSQLTDRFNQKQPALSFWFMCRLLLLRLFGQYFGSSGKGRVKNCAMPCSKSVSSFATSLTSPALTALPRNKAKQSRTPCATYSRSSVSFFFRPVFFGNDQIYGVNGAITCFFQKFRPPLHHQNQSLLLLL